MNKIKFYFILSILSLALFSCSRSNNDVEITPPRDYATQYTTDINNIENYLKTYYIEEVTADYDVKLTKIPEGGTQTSIFAQAVYPLKFREVKLHDIVYKLYYLELQKGTGESPTNVDAVLTAYKKDYLKQETKENVTALSAIEVSKLNYPQDFLSLFTLETYTEYRGWSEILPQFKTGTYSANPDGTIAYKDFGAGVMFIPSGLAYYSLGSGSIPAYAPLVVNFKLYEIQRLDRDGDGIPSYKEDLNNDGYMYDYRSDVLYPKKPEKNLDDTDSDGIPDYLDVDDDGDGFTTKLERSYKDANGVTKYYDFGAIPACVGGNGKKRHLDASCHN